MFAAQTSMFDAKRTEKVDPKHPKPIAVLLQFRKYAGCIPMGGFSPMAIPIDDCRLQPQAGLYIYTYIPMIKNNKLLDITTQVTHQNHPNSTPTRRPLGLPGMWIDHLRKAEQGVAPRVRPWRRDHVTNDEQKYLAAGCIPLRFLDVIQSMEPNIVGVKKSPIQRVLGKLNQWNKINGDTLAHAVTRTINCVYWKCNPATLFGWERWLPAHGSPLSLR